MLHFHFNFRIFRAFWHSIFWPFCLFGHLIRAARIVAIEQLTFKMNNFPPRRYIYLKLGTFLTEHENILNYYFIKNNQKFKIHHYYYYFLYFLLLPYIILFLFWSILVKMKIR